jgi:hypothetical protein
MEASMKVQAHVRHDQTLDVNESQSNQSPSDRVLALMRRIGAEIDDAFAPQSCGQHPVGSQYDYDAAVAQARFDMRQALAGVRTLDQAYELAQNNLRRYVRQKNERYKSDYMLQRWSEHGQDKLRVDCDAYRRAYASR